MSSTTKDLKTPLRDVREKYDKLNETNMELNARLFSLKEDYTQVNINLDNLSIAYEILFIETHNIDVATSYDDLNMNNEQVSNQIYKQVQENKILNKIE
jgi:predicted nuclease with TOPRIM domain